MLFRRDFLAARSARPCRIKLKPASFERNQNDCALVTSAPGRRCSMVAST